MELAELKKIRSAGQVLLKQGPRVFLSRIFDRLAANKLVSFLLGRFQTLKADFLRGELVVFYPVVMTKTELQDVMTRACWYLVSQNVREFRLRVANEGLVEEAMCLALPDGFDPQIAKLLPEFVAKTRFLVQEDNSTVSLTPSAGVFLCFRRDESSSGTATETRLSSISKTPHHWCVDPNNDPREGANYTSAAFHLMRDKTRFTRESRQRFDLLLAKLGRFDRCNVIATGPSFSEWEKLDYRNALNIVCNSTIADQELMRKMKPQIVVFADPIFHFGPSEYAGRFRKELRAAASLYDFSVLIPLKYLGIFLSAMPDLSHRVIGIPFETRDDFNLDLQQEFVVRVTANILTLLMLPVATTFARQVFLVGCDGRPLSESNYFWKHNPSVQFKQELAGIQSIHKSFFAIDYDDYYETHCDLVGAFCEQAESVGKNVYSAAPSYVPALSRRERLPNSKKSESCIESASSSDIKPPGSAFPKVLIVDPTLLGSDCATGQLKKLFFSEHPSERLLHVFRKRSCLAMLSGVDIDQPGRSRCPSFKKMLGRVRAFEPDVIYFRSTGDVLLDGFIRQLLVEWPAYFILHVMDDWPSRMRALKKPDLRAAEDRFRQLTYAADRLLCISDEMSHSFCERYGKEFLPIANGVGSNRIAKEPKHTGGKVVVRYLGALAPDMNRQALTDVAAAVNAIGSDDLILEIYTSNSWVKGAQQNIEESRYVKLRTARETEEDYWHTLRESDVLLIAYNFDEVSHAYTRHSFANKLPECLASGAAILGYGPEGNATLEFVKRNRVGMVVNEQGQQFVQQALLQFKNNDEYREELASRALHLARERFQAQDVVNRFRIYLAGEVTDRP